jgi:hypothetical protein
MMVNAPHDPWSPPIARGASGRTLLLALVSAFGCLVLLGALLLEWPPSSSQPVMQMSTSIGHPAAPSDRREPPATQ